MSFPRSWNLQIVVLFMILVVSQGAKVLVLSPPIWSQINQPLQVSLQLQEKFGHNVTFLLDQKEIDKIENMYPNTFHFQKVSIDFQLNPNELIPENICSHKSSFLLFKILSKAPKMIGDYCIQILENNEVIDQLKEFKYDIILLNSAPMFRGCYSILPYKLGIPFVLLGSFYDPVSMGIPFYPSVTPLQVTSNEGNKMTFTQRLKNFVMFLFFHFSDNIFYSDSIVKQYAPEKPSVGINDILKNASLWLVDTDSLMDVVRPSVPNVKFVGGLASSAAKELTLEFKNFMDMAKEGVIIVSFGSILRIERDRLDVILAALNRTTSVKFVMKIDKEDNPKNLGNHILTSPWLPQNDLLAHPNTVAFISHCGANSILQAIYHGVPIMGIPVVTDGHQNAVSMSLKGYGIILDYCALAEEDVIAGINSILSGPYKSSIQKASAIFHSEKPPNERAAFWIDHVIKYGGKHLQNPGLDLPYYKLYSLDIIIFMIVVIGFVSFLFLTCLKKCVRYVFKCIRKRKQD